MRGAGAPRWLPRAAQACMVAGQRSPVGGKSMFKGSCVALITPFRNGAVDERAYQDLVAWQIEQGPDVLVPCGTTGESPTLSHDEHNRVVELCIEASNRKVPVIAGAGSNSTAEAIALTRHAKKAGADAVLVVTPYYNKPTQEGLYQHFKAINDAVDIPIVIYNIPPRSVVDMSVATMARLAELKNIVGVKDATTDLARPLRTRLSMGAEFCQLSGDDITTLAELGRRDEGPRRARSLDQVSAGPHRAIECADPRMPGLIGWVVAKPEAAVAGVPLERGGVVHDAADDGEVAHLVVADRTNGHLV